MKTTMREVAERAGVSKAAVSYIVNGREGAMRIPDDTRQRILDAIRELDYNPNVVARNLSRQATQTIAVVMQYPRLFSGGAGFTNELMHGITDAAIAQGYDVLLHTRTAGAKEEKGSAEDTSGVQSAKCKMQNESGVHSALSTQHSLLSPDATEAEVANLIDGRVDGALLLRDVNDPLAANLERRGFPTVLMFTHPPDDAAEMWYVDCDNVTGGTLATEHLLNLGHRNVAHLAGPIDSGAGRERRQGYERALTRQGIAIRPEWIVEVPGPFADLNRAVELFTGSGVHGEKPTAVFAWSDDVALQLIRALRQSALRVPQDVAVVGFDSTPLCDHTDPPLTSVRQPVYVMASQAMELLAARLRGERPEQTQLRFAPELHIRRSCGASGS